MLRQSQYIDSDGVIDPLKFSSTMLRIIDDLNNKKFPTTKLLYDQYQAIENYDLEELISGITAKYSPQLLRPVGAYIGTGENGYDHMVDDKTSGENFCRYVMGAGLNCIRAWTPEAVHMYPELSTDQYEATFAEIGPRLQELMQIEQSRYELLLHNLLA